MKKTVATIVLALSGSIAYAEAVVDVIKIAGKYQNEVAAYLGKSTSCSKGKYGMKCQYKKGETEIVFINGKVDWITVEGIDHIPFSKNALASLGLKAKRPSFRDTFTLRWENIQGLMSVSLFKGAANSDYAYIKVKTE